MKLNTAFISSTGDLTNERNAVLKTLLTQDIFPFCMENFTVDSIGGFEQIEELIRDSDFFIIILGTRYGSIDSNTSEKQSYTEKEYLYAIKNREINQTRILVFLLEDAENMVKNADLSDEQLTRLYDFQTAEETRKQISFINKVVQGNMVFRIEDNHDMSQRLIQFIQHGKEKTRGWFRGISLQQLGIEFDRDYYHFHVTEGDDKYLRIGKMKFSVNNIEGIPQIRIQAVNYKAVYDKERRCLEESSRHKSEWEGNYSIIESNKMKGIYTVSRHTSETTHDQQIERGERNGIHIFTFETETPYFMSGVSQDAYPKNNINHGLKSCDIFVFDDKEKRLEFLEREYFKVLEKIQRSQCYD